MGSYNSYLGVTKHNLKASGFNNPGQFIKFVVGSKTPPVQPDPAPDITGKLKQWWRNFNRSVRG